MIFKAVAYIGRAYAITLKFLQLSVREVLVKWQKALFACHFSHERMIDHDQVITFSYCLDGSFTKFLQAARFPLNSNVGVMFRKTL